MVTSDAKLRTSGNEVFGGSYLNLNATEINITMKRLVAVKPLPGVWLYVEQDTTGFEAPVIKLQGIYDASVTHGAQETGSNIDFQFLNELHRSSGLMYFQDSYLQAVDGNDFLVDIIELSTQQKAVKNIGAEGAASRSPTTPYSMTLVVVSGTPLFSGTGILMPGEM